MSFGVVSPETMDSTVVVLGAHSAVGASLLECLEVRDLHANIVAATTTEHVLGALALIDAALIERGDLFVLAFDGKMAAGLAQGLLHQGKPVIDLAGVLPEARVVAPTLDDAAHTHLPKPVRIATGLAEPIASVLAALGPFAPKQAFISTYESAAVFDRPGMDELTEQVRAVFTMKDLVAERFGATLAFDTIPTLGQPEDDAAVYDQALSAEITAMLPAPIPLRVTRVLVPTLSADAVVLDVEVEGTPDRETVVTALNAAKGHRYVETAPPSVDAVGRDHALVGRLTVEPGRVACWIAADRLRRGSATQAATLVERWLSALNGGSSTG